MFLFGNRFYALFLSIWIIGLYFVFSVFHHSSTNQDKESEERVKYLQNEIQSLQDKIREIEGKNRDQPSGCEQINEELTRVKRQLKERGAETQRKITNESSSWRIILAIALDAPALEYEQLRRKIETQARELSYFTTDQMMKIPKKLTEGDQANLRNILDRFVDQSRSVFHTTRNWHFTVSNESLSCLEFC